MIKLWNHTGLPDKPIQAILTYAACKVGLRGDTAVKVTDNRTADGFGGIAHRGHPYLSYLQREPRHHRKANTSRRTAKVQFGWTEIPLPWQRAAQDRTELEKAESFLHTALHELSHIRDFRDYNDAPDPRTASGRRIRHDSRPCEIRANDRAWEALQAKSARCRADELVLHLAIAIEQAARGRIDRPKKG